jgi:hypothetical protein
VIALKVLNLSKGEAAYIIIPEGTNVIMEPTDTRQKGKKFVLVRNI